MKGTFFPYNAYPRSSSSHLPCRLQTLSARPCNLRSRFGIRMVSRYRIRHRLVKWHRQYRCRRNEHPIAVRKGNWERSDLGRLQWMMNDLSLPSWQKCSGRRPVLKRFQ